MVNPVKFFRLSAAEKRVLFQAAAWLVLWRVLLAAAPFARVQQLVARACGRRGGSAPGCPDAPAPFRIGYLVAAAANFIPGTTCLPRALATQVLLGRHGHGPELHIGVNRDSQGRFQAHAWVETGGRVVIGGPEVTGYKPILRTA
jgi:hypothetical protein